MSPWKASDPYQKKKQITIQGVLIYTNYKNESNPIT